MRCALRVIFSILAIVPVAAGAQSTRAAECPSCAEWNQPQAPFKVFGNTFYVGTRGLGAILITSSRGHVLIDGGLPESAPLILANIRALGFRVEDVKEILNSHAHYDHAGGIAAIQRASGAEVAATQSSALTMERGLPGSDDPQFGLALTYPQVPFVRAIRDGEQIRVGDLTLTAHVTAGHTPGGTTWTWHACDGERCLSLVYADSQTPVSMDGFLYTKSTAYPTGISDFEHGFGVLEHLACDILLTPHPSASHLWERVALRDAGDQRALVNRDACRQYAATGRQALAVRIAREEKPQ